MLNLVTGSDRWGGRALADRFVRAARLASALAGLAVGGAMLAAPVPALAGGQQYEPMSVSIRSALAAAVADDRTPPEPRFESMEHQLEWLIGMADRLPRRHKPGYRERVEFLQMVRYEAQRAGLDPHLVLGLIEVESNFRRFAISSVGARGYMQVMPFWTKVIGDGEPSRLFDARTNLRFGCLILRHYLDIERGDLFRALGRYNGSLGRPEYPNLVLRAWRKWESYDSFGRGIGQQVTAPAAIPAADTSPTAAPPSAAPSAAPSALSDRLPPTATAAATTGVAPILHRR